MADTIFTGPIKAGNVLQSDGSGTLAGEGGSSGTANVGYAVMAQSEAVTQATNGSSAGVYTTSIVIPAGSQILSVTLLVTTAWTGADKTVGIGTTASATAITAAGAVDGSAKGVVSANPGTVDAAYRGELQCILINHDPVNEISFKKGDRIAQLVIQAVEEATFIEVESLPGKIGRAHV